MSNDNKKVVCDDNEITNIDSVHNFVQIKETIQKPLSKKFTLKNYNNSFKHKLINIIGELHEDIFKCNKNSISVIDYSINRLKNNDNCRLFLEAPSFFNYNDLPKVGSQAVRDVHKKIDESMFEKYVYNIDNRSILLKENDKNEVGLKRQGDLYYNFDKLYIKPILDSLSKKNDINKSLLIQQTNPILYNYVLPYTVDKLLNISPIENKHPYKNQLNLYIRKLNSMFTDIYNKVIEITEISYSKTKEGDFNKVVDQLKIKNKVNITLNNIHSSLKMAWAMVLDFVVITKIMENNDINEYIIIVGDWHMENISKTLSEFPNCSILQEKLGGRRNKCINTKGLKTFCSL